MTLNLKPMTMEAYASFERMLGAKIVQAGDTYWRKVRPCFYRPLLPTAEYAPGSLKRPVESWLGAVQYPVSLASEANSFFYPLLDEAAATYSTSRLDAERQRQIRQAAKKFEMREIVDLAEFKASAHAVYVSFYERTRYEFGTERLDPVFFAKWADDLFAIPGLFILGAYRDGALRGVSVSLHVEDTVSYSMSFCDSESMRQNLSNLMLHSVREAAVQSRGVKQVYVGNFKNEKGLDDYYLQRGFRAVKRPALLKINPVAKLALKWVMPRQFTMLVGMLDGAAL